MNIIEIADHVLELNKKRDQVLVGDAHWLNIYGITKEAPILAKAVKDQAAEIKRLIDLLRPAANHFYGSRMTVGDCNEARRAVMEYDAKGKVANG